MSFALYSYWLQVLCAVFAPTVSNTLPSYASVQDAWVLVMRSRTSAIHVLKPMLIHCQDNGSIMCSLVTIAHIEREEAGRLSLPLHDDPHEYGTLCVQATVVVNEARLSGPVREETAA